MDDCSLCTCDALFSRKCRSQILCCANAGTSCVSGQKSLLVSGGISARPVLSAVLVPCPTKLGDIQAPSKSLVQCVDVFGPARNQVVSQFSLEPVNLCNGL